VIPVTAFRGRLRHLRHWDSRSIGTYLFSNPSLHRSEIEIAHGHLQQFGLNAPEEYDTPLWGRRSSFCLYNKQLLVSEFFLPDLK
jgi:chorismate--pyruvate lyase